MQNTTLKRQVAAETPRHATSAFGYNRSRAAILRLSPDARYRPRTTTASRSLFATILAVVAAFGQPQLREGLATEVFRAAFAGFAIFGGALFFICNLGVGLAYVALWAAFGAVRHVVREMNEAPRRQRVRALYDLG